MQTLAQYKKRLPRDSRQRLREFQIGRFNWLVNIPCALFFRKNLRMLATIYGSDKWNSHWYAQHYERQFADIRRDKLNILEIGIGGYESPRAGGNSLRMWRAYFSRAHIYGIDLYDKLPHNERRITTLRGSQIDTAFLDSIIQQIGTIDIVVDDGSHLNQHVITTFKHLFPHVAAGGFYVVEDTQTSYWPEDGNVTDRNDMQTTVGFFKALADGLNYEEFLNEHQPTYFDQNITGISFYYNLIVIKKGLNQEGSNMLHSRQETVGMSAS